ncbi:hypothetical protein GOODEAATRI_005347 [Goodea atripinnis]|uniref:Uncharacterized protein n=1 Tax=Goodea atripinnis TaxID=208336 RepID=A0ABV0PL10_9TELE
MFGAQTTPHINKRIPYPQWSMVVVALYFRADILQLNWCLSQGGGSYEQFQTPFSGGAKPSAFAEKLKVNFIFQSDNDQNPYIEINRRMVHQKNIRNPDYKSVGRSVEEMPSQSHRDIEMSEFCNETKIQPEWFSFLFLPLKDFSLIFN